MVRFEVTLIPQPGGRWAALLDNQVLSTEIRQPRPDLAQILLAQGHDPRSELVIRSGTRVLSAEPLGWASGRPVTCADVDVVERD